MLDSIGRNRNNCNFGNFWSYEEIQLLFNCQNGLSRPEAAEKYLEESAKLGYQARTVSAVIGRLNRNFKDNKSKHPWTDDEDNYLSELFQEYPFSIALDKYNHWASTRGYPKRNEAPMRGRLSAKGVSARNPLFVCSQGEIARNLGISNGTAKKYIELSGVKVEKLGQKSVCDADSFYRQFVKKNLWIACMRGVAQNGKKPDLDRWALLLPISANTLIDEWARIEQSILLVRFPLTVEPLTVSQFARETGVTPGAIRTAIREGRHRVGKVRFELVPRDRCA